MFKRLQEVFLNQIILAKSFLALLEDSKWKLYYSFNVDSSQ